jgi:hypothetical protein
VTGYVDNDGRFPDEARVEARFPLTAADHRDRDDWPWLPATVLGQCGPDEWHERIDVEDLAEDDADLAEGERWYPACFRDASELRRQEDTR